MIEPILPWITVVVAILAFALFPKQTPAEALPSRGKSAHLSGAICLAFAIAAIASCAAFQSKHVAVMPTGIGLATGAILAGLCGFLGSRFNPFHDNWFAPVAIAAAALGLFGLAPAESMISMQMGCAIGLGFGSFIVGVAPTHWPAAAAAAAFGGAILNRVSPNQPDLASHTGTLILAVSALVGTIAQVAAPKGENRRWIVGAITTVLVALVAWRASDLFQILKPEPLILPLSLAAGFLFAWMHSGNQDSKLPTLLGAIISVAGGTLAFGLLKSEGLALAFLGLLIPILLTGSWRAISSIAPLFALLAIRVMNLEFPTEIRSFDISQHYSLIGLSGGLLSALIAWVWRTERNDSTHVNLVFASGIWALLLAALPFALAVSLGAKGFAGAVIGSGLVALLVNQTGQDSLRAFALSASLSLACAISVSWFEPVLQFTRSEKSSALIGFAIAAVILAAIISLLTRQMNTASTQESQ